jgi:hypothetical protein
MVIVFIVTHMAMIICLISIFYKDFFFTYIYHPIRVKARFSRIQLTKSHQRIVKMAPKKNLLELLSKINILIVILFN